MSSPVTIAINGVDVPVTAKTDDISIPDAIKFVPFVNLVNKLNNDPHWVVSEIVLQSKDMFGPRIGFLKVMIKATYNGKPVPGVVFLRGDSVAILPILKCNGDRFVVTCLQPRMPDGKVKCEIPAGMMDGNYNFAGTAAKEMTEETGIVMNLIDLIDITPKGPMCPSIGGCDEKIKFYAYIKEVTPEFLSELNGKITGNFEEGEIIKIKLIKYENLHEECDDMKAMTAMLMLERSGTQF